jgi:hypothetical protein
MQNTLSSYILNKYYSLIKYDSQDLAYSINLYISQYVHFIFVTEIFGNTNWRLFWWFCNFFVSLMLEYVMFRCDNNFKKKKIKLYPIFFQNVLFKINQNMQTYKTVDNSINL